LVDEPQITIVIAICIDTVSLLVIIQMLSSAQIFLIKQRKSIQQQWKSKWLVEKYESAWLEIALVIT
jgi:hypothetical protein